MKKNLIHLYQLQDIKLNMKLEKLGKTAEINILIEKYKTIEFKLIDNGRPRNNIASLPSWHGNIEARYYPCWMSLLNSAFPVPNFKLPLNRGTPLEPQLGQSFSKNRIEPGVLCQDSVVQNYY
ncbi:hypothetical protein H8356DRAFT_1321343 [Neocallimastix lanati (nom. inval.)]|nr:hypothetical protein H8356DRAFT_1321343 [Neocallimastix sp. JGI-2020a]